MPFSHPFIMFLRYEVSDLAHISMTPLDIYHEKNSFATHVVSECVKVKQI